MAKSGKGPVRWGVVSTAKIGWEKVLPGFLKSKQIELRAIASRSLSGARKWAKKLGIPVAYGSYEELLDDPEIEAVYNPLPNHLHVPLTMAAARKGKHVLCEKPIALTAKEAEELRAAPPGILIAEAFMVRHHPQWHKARELVRKGKLGTVNSMQVVFSYNNTDPDNVRNQADIGGGGIYDIGCYPIVTARYIFDAEPVRVIALVDRDPTFRTDRNAGVLVDFGGGRHLIFTVAMQSAPFQRANIMGSKARLEVEIPFNAPQGGAMRIYLDDGSKFAGAAAKVFKIEKADQYQLEGEAFSAAVRGKAKLDYGVEDAIQQARILDAIFRSEKSGNWETP